MSEHFSVAELSCRCGCGYCAPSADLITLAEEIRAILGKPMIVHSCCRCARHNAEVGGKKDSKHLTGHAMDFSVQGMSPAVVRAYILNAYACRGQLSLLGGIGLYKWGVHIDIDKAADGHLRMWEG